MLSCHLLEEIPVQSPEIFDKISGLIGHFITCTVCGLIGLIYLSGRLGDIEELEMHCNCGVKG